MAIGLAALLDDVAAIAKSAAASVDDVAAMTGKASARAMALVVDDAAVTPQYLKEATPNRELPMVWRIAKGSLLNKAIILPIILIISTVYPPILTPLLMLGGLYLSFEGAEKIIEHFTNDHPDQEAAAVDEEPKNEDEVVRSAVTTDFILSLEIMVISLSTIADQPLGIKIVSLIFVAIIITAVVYGAVALLIRIDDTGLKLMADKNSDFKQKLGRSMVTSMPTILNVISVIGTMAMLWVGGHILLSGLATLGLEAPHEIVALAVGAVEGVVGGIPVLGPVLSWLTDTLCSAIFALVVGSILAVIISLFTHEKQTGKVSLRKERLAKQKQNN